EKEKLDYAEDGTRYSDVHKKYHPWFRKALNTREYYDIFLFDMDGNLIYSVFKELDYATNLNRGQWKDSGLGEIFRAAKANLIPEHQAFIDFKPYAPSYDAPASFIGAPVFDNGKAIGVLAFQMSISRMNALMQDSTGLGESGESYIIGDDFLMRSDSRFSEETTILSRKVETASAKEAIAGNSGSMVTADYRGISVKSVYSPIEFMGTHWAILAEIDEAEYEEPILVMRNSMALVGGLLLLVVGMIGTFFARGITKALVSITSAMKKLAGGDHSIEIPMQDRADEIGDMAKALQIFREGAIEQLQLQQEAKEAAEREAESERQRGERQAARLDEERDRERNAAERNEARATKIATIIKSFEGKISALLGKLTGSATELQATANGLVKTADGSQALSSAVAASSQQASANVQTVASAAEELSSSIGEINRQVDQASNVSQEAVQEAESTTQSVAELASAAKKISEVVDMISDIAGQTNLLALNATIEAARAGEAGKGFAVVASEVKNLATQTAKATDEISAQISGMQIATDGAVSAIGNIESVIRTIREATVSISSAVNEQNAATDEISRSVQEASRGTDEVSTKIVEVSDKANETGSAASSVLSASESLDHLANNLKEDIEVFLEEIRVA
ncbi:MAG: HAMP domain-containing protein, partial [Sneathiella sp.]|nr:HAMP domain-containing protein [Sneathiella sp.]